MAAMGEENKAFACSRSLKHTPNCDGFCGTVELSDLEVELNEERRLWDEAGMKPIGTIYGPGVPPGIPVDVHHVEVSVAAIIETLIENGIVTRENLNNHFQRMMIDRLRNIRLSNEDAVKAQRTQELKQKITPPIFLPDHFNRKKPH